MNAKYLLLANGMVFAGQSVGAGDRGRGGVLHRHGAFRRPLTDPSYYGQFITQTYPHRQICKSTNTMIWSPMTASGQRATSREACTTLQLAL